VLHVAAALVLEQAESQAPQFERLFSAVSQPLVSTPSQLPYPELHVETEQTPVAQVAEAFVRPHVVRQAPQLEVVLSGVSQPLTSRPSQSP
jgi:hypothetical protein